VCVCVPVYMYVCIMSVGRYVCMCVCMYVCMNVCVCMYVCMYVYICIFEGVEKNIWA
jgi:nuclear pore complex protein Nup62